MSVSQLPRRALIVLVHQLAFLTLPLAVIGQESVWQSLNNSGLEALNKGNTDQALPLLEKAVKAAEGTFGATDVRTCQSYTFLGECLYTQGKYTEAEKYFQKSYAVLRLQTGKEYQFMSVYNCRLLAYARVQLNMNKEAVPLFDWVTQMEERFQVMPESLGDDLSTFASALERLEKYDAAQARLQQCLKFYSKSNGENDTKTMLVRLRLITLKQRQLKFDEAEAAVTDFTTQIESIRTNNPNGAGSLYLEQSAYYQNQQRWTKARQFAQLALEAFEASDTPSDREMNLVIARLGDIEYGLEHLVKGDEYYKRLLARQEQAKPFQEIDLAPTLEKLAWSSIRQKIENSVDTLLDRSLGIRRRRQGAEHEDVAIPLHLKAELLSLRGDHKEAEATHLQALRLRERAKGTGSAAAESSVFELVSFYHGRKQSDRVERLLRNSLEQREKLVGPQSSELNMLLSRFAGWFAAQGKLEDAEKLLKRAVTNAEKLGQNDLAVAVALSDLAHFYEYVSRYTEAEALFARVVQIRESRQGPYHLQTAIAWRSLAWTKQRLGKASEGLPLAEKAASLCRASLDEDSGELAQTINILAVCLDHTGDTDSARRDYKYALSLYERQGNLEGAATVLHNLATVTIDNEEAKALYEKSLAISHSTLESESNFVGRLLDLGNLSRGHRNLGDLLRKMGHWNDAHSHYLKALQACEDGLGEDHELLIDALKAMGWIEYDCGQAVEAGAYFERALRLTEKREGPRTAGVADLLRAIGWVRLAQGRFAESESSFLSDLALRREISNRYVADSLTGSAATALYLGKMTEADRQLQEAIEAFGDDENSESFAVLQLLLARRRLWDGDLKQARKCAEQALSVLDALGTVPQRRLQGQLMLSELQLTSGEYEQAEKSIRAVLEVARAKIGNERTIVGQALHQLATLQLDQAEFAQAKKHCEQAQEIFRKILGAESYHVAECELLNLEAQLGQAQLAPDALDQCRTAMARLEKAHGTKSPFLAAGLLTEARILGQIDRSKEQREVLERIQKLLQESAALKTCIFIDLQQQLARLEMKSERYQECESALRLADETLMALDLSEHPRGLLNAKLHEELMQRRAAKPKP